MARSKQEASFDLNDMLGLLAAGIKNPHPNNLQYEPHPRQVQFHCSEKGGRQLLGGNRSGKTVSGINEDIWWLTGRHPYLRLPSAPIYGRIVTVDFKNGMHKIILPQLRQWLAPSDLINGSWEDSYNGALNVLTLANDSEVEIMSHEQELDKFAGVPRHFTHFDEEPPFDIFKECKARLVDYNGRWWMTMTPVEGMTWTFEEIFEKHSNLIDIIEVSMWDNPYLTPEAIAALLEDLDEDEKAIRGKGAYVAISGLVFKHFNPEIHVIPAGIPPSTWTHYVSLDAGFSNPTAVLWHAVEPNTGRVVTYHEHYKSEWTTEQHAKVITEYNEYLRTNFGIVPFLHIADPAIKQRQQTTGHSIQIEYANNGVYFALGKQRDVMAGLDKMNNYHRLHKWFLTEDCPNFIREKRMYKKSQYSTSKTREANNKKEEPQKKNDHACDSARYFFSYMPELDAKATTPKKESLVLPQLLDASAPRKIHAPGLRFDPSFDSDLSKPQFVQDEFVGEW
jgi:phage terminase large subunit-like protein